MRNCIKDAKFNMKITASKKLESLKPYAFAEINERVEALKKSGVKPIDFGVGDPSEPTPEFVIESLSAAGRKHAKTGYPSYIGSLEFRKAAAGYMKRRFGVLLDPEKEISSNIGSKEAIFNFPQGFIDPGDIVIMPSPGYPPMKTGTIFAGGVPYFVPLLEKNNFLIDYAAIPESVCKAAKIIWTNYPNSPTGAVAGREYYEGLMAWAKKWNIIIAADEGCYIDIYFGEKPMSILEVGREGVIAFYSLSKRNNMTGYRVGFVAGDSEIVSIFKKLKTNIDSGTASVIQEAAIVALGDDKHVERMRGIYKEKRDVLVEGLMAMGLEVRVPEATFYVWQKVPSGMSDVEFAKKLLALEVGIVVTPGSLISDECETGDGERQGGTNGISDWRVNPGAGYVRFALMPSMSEVKEAVERLRKMRG